MNSQNLMQICALSAALLVSCSSDRTYVLIKQLTDPKTTDVARSELIASCKSDPKLTAHVSAVIPELLSSNPEDPVMRSEAQIAGSLKIKAAIPILARLLGRRSWNPGGSFYAQEHLSGDAVARALYEMGPAAYPALDEALKDGNRDARTRAMSVLLLANTVESLQILRAHIGAEPDTQLQNYLRVRISEARPSHP